MKKLHSLAFYALVTPAIALGSSALLAEQSADKAADQEMKSSQQDQDPTKATAGSAQGNQSGMQNQQYMDSAPAGGLQASELINADIRTTDEEDVGSVTDLIIDKDGQVVAVVVGVGGFLGMAEKDVAINWDDLNVSRDSDELELRIDMTRDDLNAAPSYEKLDD